MLQSKMTDVLNGVFAAGLLGLLPAHLPLSHSLQFLRALRFVAVPWVTALLNTHSQGGVVNRLKERSQVK